MDRLASVHPIFNFQFSNFNLLPTSTMHFAPLRPAAFLNHGSELTAKNAKITKSLSPGFQRNPSWQRRPYLFSVPLPPPGLPLPQRGFVPKPKVVRNEQPWVSRKISANPKRVAAKSPNHRTIDKIGLFEADCRNPVGVGSLFPETQGSRRGNLGLEDVAPLGQGLTLFGPAAEYLYGR